MPASGTRPSRAKDGQKICVLTDDDDVARQREAHARADRGAVDRRDDRKAKAAEAQDQRVHETAHFEMRALPRLQRLQIDRVQIQAAAEHVVAAGDHDGACAAVAFLDLIEREVHRANDGDVDGVADGRSLNTQRCDAVGNGEG